jgi:16S rRNA (uracil1498-N3)-methyltransferase
VVPRFFAPGAEQPGDITDLPHDEAQHLTRVLRLKAGAKVRVFNGRGAEFDAEVESLDKHHVSVLIGAPRTAAEEPRVAVTLAQAILKGDKMDDVVRDAVMMGAAAIQPMVTTRAEVTLANVARSRRCERWERIAIAAAKQSGRATVPAILEPRAFSDVVDALGHLTLPGPGLMFVEPSAAADTLGLGDMDDPPPRETTIVIGPEGGWDPQEIDQGASACRLVTLGGRTLRADVMATIALAALFALWREY